MSLPLSAEEAAEYTLIIDGILTSSDLTTVTRKNIRIGLESALGGKDLSTQKGAIKKLIEQRFDAISGASQGSDNPASSVPEPSPDALPPKRHANGHLSEDHETLDDESHAEIEVSVAQPAKKRQKREESSEDADAKLAAELQAQENRMARGRTTRGGTGNTQKVAKRKKAPRKKSDKKVRADGDSDGEGSEASVPAKRKAGGGFQKPFNLSYQLQELVGETQLSRPQVVKRLWEHIKAHDLQDPKDKRQIRCDDKMQAVFKQTKVDMFQMNKIIGNHLYPLDE